MSAERKFPDGAKSFAEYVYACSAGLGVSTEGMYEILSRNLDTLPKRLAWWEELKELSESPNTPPYHVWCNLKLCFCSNLEIDRTTKRFKHPKRWKEDMKRWKENLKDML